MKQYICNECKTEIIDKKPSRLHTPGTLLPHQPLRPGLSLDMPRQIYRQRIQRIGWTLRSDQFIVAACVMMLIITIMIALEVQVI